MEKNELEIGEWYVGEGRLGPLAKWTGTDFVAPDYDCGFWVCNHMEYGDRGFTPEHKWGK